MSIEVKSQPKPLRAKAWEYVSELQKNELFKAKSAKSANAFFSVARVLGRYAGDEDDWQIRYHNPDDNCATYYVLALASELP